MISGKWVHEPKTVNSKNQAFYMDAMGDHGIINSRINREQEIFPRIELWKG